MNAQEARNIAHEAQMNMVYRKLKEEIEDAVKEGNFSIYIFQKLVPELIAKLETEGFTVIESTSGTTIIKW